MPKVTMEYIENTKANIVAAAGRVFESKSFIEMTMLDVIKEANLSKGGIYRYYRDIDDVIVDYINRTIVVDDRIESVQRIVDETTTFEMKLINLFGYLVEYMIESADVVGKIQFELTMLYAGKPERAMKIMPRLDVQDFGQLMMQHVFETIRKGEISGEFHLRYAYDDIVRYIQTYLDGAIKYEVLYRCYDSGMNMQLKSSMHLFVESLLKMVK